MIHAYGDVSMDEDEDILAVGYVIFRSRHGDEELLDTGTRVVNMTVDDRPFEWDSARGEFYSAIIATRAALDYTQESIILRLDNKSVVEAIKEGHEGFETYFHHSLRSFMHRFNDWYVQLVHRKNNTFAHEQARIGLRMGREIKSGTL